MPELPEVETVRLQLLHKVKNRTVKSVQVHNLKSVDSNKNFSNLVTGKIINHIDRIGKLMIFSFKNEDDFFLLAHLKMTGQFLLLDNTGNVNGGGHTLSPTDIHLPNSHTRITFTLDNDTKFFFNDMRKFGYVKIASKSEMLAARSRFGPEPINKNFNIKHLFTGLQKKRVSIKAALLDQTFIAGLGNIYVDEVLFASKISPLRTANTINKTEARLIAKSSYNIMNKSISVGGTTFQHFADTNGQHGNYKDYLKVFGQQNQPCPRCKTTILKIRVAGRGTHYCPNCQK